MGRSPLGQSEPTQQPSGTSCPLSRWQWENPSAKSPNLSRDSRSTFLAYLHSSSLGLQGRGELRPQQGLTTAKVRATLLAEQKDNPQAEEEGLQETGLAVGAAPRSQGEGEEGVLELLGDSQQAQEGNKGEDRKGSFLLPHSPKHH